MFDRSVARGLGPDDAVLVTCCTASLRALRRCRELGILSFLDYPISHHRWSADTLAEEAARQPKFAETLQYHRFTAAEWAQLDDEIGLADKILVLSTFQKRTFVECGVDDAKLAITPLGVDLKLFRPGEKRRPDGVFRVVFVGQITQRKGLSYLLAGFEQAAIPDSRLLLVGKPIGGTGSWRAQPRVSHKPHEPRSRLPRVYHDADVMVLPSIVEGFGLTALEAMACGLPVIVSENTFGSDVITDGIDGYVVPIRDPGAIAERLRHLWANPSLRTSMGLAARRRAEAFSWDAYGRLAVEVIRGAYSGGPSRHS